MASWRANRLDELPPYLFVEIDRKKREAIAAGRDVIDFGVGDPDQPTPAFIVDRMADAIRKPANHRYALGIGGSEFRTAVADFFVRRFGVKLDPKTEIVALLGSKEGLGHLPTAVVNPGQTVLIPDPGYPVYTGGTVFAGGKCHTMSLRESNDWLPVLGDVPAEVRRTAKLMFLNYPNNPTAACAPLSFFEEAVAFAREHHILIAQDAAYSEVYFAPDRPPPSILQVEGAKDVAVEFHSLSKTFNMTGWRIGFAVGNTDALAALAKVKNNVDSGVFGAVQEAGIEALESILKPLSPFPKAGTEALWLIKKPLSPPGGEGRVRGFGDTLISDSRRREIISHIDPDGTYRRRRDVLIAGLRESGWSVASPQATFYVWAKCPGGLDSMTVASRVLDDADVVIIPGIGFGRCGEGHVRFALTVDESRTAKAVERIARLKW